VLSNHLSHKIGPRTRLSIDVSCSRLRLDPSAILPSTMEPKTHYLGPCVLDSKHHPRSHMMTFDLFIKRPVTQLCERKSNKFHVPRFSTHLIILGALWVLPKNIRIIILCSSFSEPSWNSHTPFKWEVLEVCLLLYFCRLSKTIRLPMHEVVGPLFFTVMSSASWKTTKLHYKTYLSGRMYALSCPSSVEASASAAIFNSYAPVLPKSGILIS
jgi:hypothetical protein